LFIVFDPQKIILKVFTIKSKILNQSDY